MSDTETTLDHLDYAYFETDLSGVFTHVNDAFCRQVGYARAAVVGRHYRHFTDRRHIHALIALFASIYESGQPNRQVEYHFRRPDGTLIFAEGAVALRHDAAGAPTGFCGIAHDVTDRKQAEAEVLRAKIAAERELEIGRLIQASFLPRELPKLEGWDIAGRFEAAREVAGDFYDAFALSGGKRMGLVLGDVCDKGVGAALFMGLFRSLIRAFADQHYSLGWMDVLSSEPQGASVGRRRALLSTGTTALKNAIDLTNQYISRNHGHTSMFATIFFGLLDPATGALMYINGGHEPPAIVGPNGVKARLEPTGPAVGLFPGVEFGIEQVELEPGDALLIFTDGVSDARNPRNEAFTEERLLALTQEPFLSVAELLDRIHSALRQHIGNAIQYDDITLLGVRRKSAAAT